MITEAERANNAAYYKANKEKIKAKSAAYYAANKEYCKARNAAWQRENIEHVLVKHNQWRQANPEKARASRSKWSRNNLDAGARMTARRRSRLRNAYPAWAESEIIELIYAEASHRGLQVDHVIPLHHHLVCGLHVHNNMQLLSIYENGRKRNNFEPINE